MTVTQSPCAVCITSTLSRTCDNLRGRGHRASTKK